MPRDGAEAVREFVDQAEEVRPEPPRPLIRELPPADLFPVDALGGILGAAATAINDRVQAPIAICGQSTLAAATLATQGHADVQLPTNQIRPISNFFVTIAMSGERKTAVDNEALGPFRNWERTLREDYERTLPEYENDKTAWEKARDQAVKKAKGDRAAIRSALNSLGPPPAAPLTPMLTCQEPTYEGLIKHLPTGQPSVGIFTPEGGQFIGGHGMTEEAKLRTAAGFSCLWDGETIKRVRAGDGVIILPGRRVAMHLMAQPDIAAIMLADPLLLNQGLLSRCLVTAPESNSGSRLWHEPAVNSEAAIKRYGAHILDILEYPLPLAMGKTNELSPRVLTLAPDARKMWIGFVNNIESQIGPDGALAPVRGLANKLPEHAARFATVLTLVADLEAGEVSADHMAAGIVFAQHYAAEALRMFAIGRNNGDLLLAQKLLGWLIRSWTEGAISLPDIYQYGPNEIRDRTTAKRLVTVLQEHGWLVRIEGGAVVAGCRRRDAWQIIRAA